MGPKKERKDIDKKFEEGVDRIKKEAKEIKEIFKD